MPNTRTVASSPSLSHASASHEEPQNNADIGSSQRRSSSSSPQNAALALPSHAESAQDALGRRVAASPCSPWRPKGEFKNPRWGRVQDLTKAVVAAHTLGTSAAPVERTEQEKAEALQRRWLHTPAWVNETNVLVPKSQSGQISVDTETGLAQCVHNRTVNSLLRLAQRLGVPLPPCPEHGPVVTVEPSEDAVQAYKEFLRHSVVEQVSQRSIWGNVRQHKLKNGNIMIPRLLLAMSAGTDCGDWGAIGDLDRAAFFRIKCPDSGWEQALNGCLSGTSAQAKDLRVRLNAAGMLNSATQAVLDKTSGGFMLGSVVYSALEASLVEKFAVPAEVRAIKDTLAKASAVAGAWLTSALGIPREFFAEWGDSMSVKQIQKTVEGAGFKWSTLPADALEASVAAVFCAVSAMFNSMALEMAHDIEGWLPRFALLAGTGEAAMCGAATIIALTLKEEERGRVAAIYQTLLTCLQHPERAQKLAQRAQNMQAGGMSKKTFAVGTLVNVFMAGVQATVNPVPGSHADEDLQLTRAFTFGPIEAIGFALLFGTAKIGADKLGGALAHSLRGTFDSTDAKQEDFLALAIDAVTDGVDAASENNMAYRPRVIDDEDVDAVHHPGGWGKYLSPVNVGGFVSDRWNNIIRLFDIPQELLSAATAGWVPRPLNRGLVAPREQEPLLFGGRTAPPGLDRESQSAAPEPQAVEASPGTAEIELPELPGRFVS